MAAGVMVVIMRVGGGRTQYLLVGEAHDVHGVHGLLEVVLVLLPRDGEVAVG